jgi:hypothetical protein
MLVDDIAIRRDDPAQMRLQEWKSAVASLNFPAT